VLRAVIGGQTGTVRRMTLPLITNNQLNSWFYFFDSILLIPGWVKLAEPNKVRLDIDFRVPDKLMFTQPLLGPDSLSQGCEDSPGC
jgi:TRAP-type mannitol/chloroaromatic compound transport system permease small subunit